MERDHSTGCESKWWQDIGNNEHATTDMDTTFEHDTFFFAPFIPGEASPTPSLRQLLRKNIAFQWQPEHDKALFALKQSLTNAPVLKYYDPNTVLTIQT